MINEGEALQSILLSTNVNYIAETLLKILNPIDYGGGGVESTRYFFKRALLQISPR